MITEDQKKTVDDWQSNRIKYFKSLPEEGEIIMYFGKEFIVQKDVFVPFEDASPLIKDFKINSGDSVLDVCTGSGVIAIFAAYNGAGKVLATDINPSAVDCAHKNINLHNFSEIMEARLSNMFDNIKEDEKFDIITGNLPFRNKLAPDVVAASVWDNNLIAHKKFFADVNKHLNPGGKIYLLQANFGAVDEMKKLAREAGFNVSLINRGEKSDGHFETFYAFELKK